MSVAGRNMVRGSSLTTYHPEETDDAIDWGQPVLEEVKVELLPATDEVAREVFGADRRVELTAMVPSSWDLLEKDGVVVNDGAYAGENLRVTARRPLGRYAEVGLERTTEAIP